MRVLILRNTPDDKALGRLGPQNREFYKESDIQAVRDALEEAGHQASIVQADLGLMPRLQRAVEENGGVQGLFVFNLAYGVQGHCRYTHVPSILEQAGLPYVGSGPRAHTIALDKYLTKVVLERAGLPTPAFQLMSAVDQPLAPALRFPLIVKPQHESTSFGIVVVRDEPALGAAVKNILDQWRQPALVEAFVPGMEVNCGLLGNGPPLALPVLEIDYREDTDPLAILDNEKKINRAVSHVCPARLSQEKTAQVQLLSAQAFDAVGCFDAARLDFRMDSNGQPWILEINSMVAIHTASSYFDAAKVLGMTHPQMIKRIFDAAVARYQ